jgi:hypothetical protein
MKLTEEQKKELEVIREGIDKLLEEQLELFKDACHYLEIEDESQRSNWVWEYLFNGLNIESLEANL